MKWSEITDKDKIRLLLEKVLGYFVLEETTTGFHDPEIPRGVNAPAGFHWPIAFWNTDCECWAYRDIGDNGVTFFDPLHDLNDAWLLVEKMKEKGASWSAFCYELDGVLTQHKRGWDEYTGKPHVTWFEHFMKALNAEGVCLAALKVVGIEVDYER